MRCPKCGNNLNENDRVCDFCGYLVIQEPKNEMIDNSNSFHSNNENDYEEEKNTKKVDIVKIIFIVAIIASVVYIALVGMKWINNKNSNKKSDDTPIQETKTGNESNNSNNQNGSGELQNGTETIIDNNGYRYIIPAYYNVYKNTEAYVELINNNDKVNIIMYKLLDMDYDLLKAAPESYVVSLQEKGMTLIKNLEKFYNNNRYYVIYCKNGNNSFYQIFTSFYGKTISFGITDYGTNEEDDLFDVVDMILANATIIS